MRFLLRNVWILSLVVVACLATVLLAQQQQAAPRQMTEEQQKEFLLKAKIVKTRNISEGITNSRCGTLTMDGFTHDAHIQTIDEYKPVYQTLQGSELNFTDSWKNNLAAYELDRLLGLNMIPSTVKRSVGGRSASLTWWKDDVLMSEKERFAKKTQPPDAERWNRQMYIVRIFDELIYNTDRNLGNLLITSDWNLWMIDHTRAFRLQKTLKNPKNLTMVDRKFMEALRGLDRGKVEEKLGPYINKSMIEGMMARRDLIVKFFEEEIRKKGEAAIIYAILPIR